MRVTRTQVTQCLLDSKEENLQRASEHVRKYSAGRAREHPSLPTPSTAFYHPVLPALELCRAGVKTIPQVCLSVNRDSISRTEPAARDSCAGMDVRSCLQITEDVSKGTSVTQSSALAKVVVLQIANHRKGTTQSQERDEEAKLHTRSAVGHRRLACAEWGRRVREGKRRTPTISTDTWLFSVTLITFPAWCWHIIKTRCLRCGSTITPYSLTSPLALLFHFQEIGCLPKRKGGVDERRK